MSPQPIAIIDEDDEPETVTSFYEHDVIRLHRVLNDYGYQATNRQARRLWELFSDTTVHGWANMNDKRDAQLVQCVRPFFTVGRR